jgi:serine protease AprX
MLNIKKLLQIAMIVLMLASFAGPAQAQTFPQGIKAQPDLVMMAAKQPGQIVSVIVRASGGDSVVEAAAVALGGKISAKLGMIHAFAVTMPASAALKLALNPAVGWVSIDAVVKSTACAECVDPTNLANAYIGAIKANKVWNTAPYLQGQGIGIAVVDSGVNPNGDLYTTMGVNRQTADVRFNSDYNQSPFDGYGHGTHVASIAGGDGSESGGQYIGVAPMVNIINVKVSNDNGSATMANVVAGLQWVLENKNTYNIRVVNLSINSAVAESYNTNPLDAAVEILWFNGIVVVVSAGNSGGGAIYPPANDPFVITVGAADDKGTSSISDDTIATFSAYGKAENGIVKPDLVAPGKNIVAKMVNLNMGIAGAHPGNILNHQYFRMSGTSMAAPMVSGAVALLLQDEPGLTPDQVKYRLKATANKSWAGYSSAKAGAGYLDIYAAVSGTSNQSENTGIKASKLLTSGSAPVNSSVSWNSVSWNSVSWNSVSWNSVSWNSVSWNSVSWNSDYWGN